MKTRGSKIILSNPGFVLFYLRVFETHLKGRDITGYTSRRLWCASKSGFTLGLTSFGPVGS